MLIKDTQITLTARPLLVDQFNESASLEIFPNRILDNDNSETMSARIAVAQDRPRGMPMMFPKLPPIS